MAVTPALDPCALTTDASGDSFFSVAGRRVIIVGGEARGIDEITVLPDVIARSLRIAGAHATAFCATRLGVSRAVVLGDTTLTETILAANDLPAALIEISAAQAHAEFELQWRVPAAPASQVDARGARLTITRANRTACAF